MGWSNAGFVFRQTEVSLEIWSCVLCVLKRIIQFSSRKMRKGADEEEVSVL